MELGVGAGFAAPAKNFSVGVCVLGSLPPATCFDLEGQTVEHDDYSKSSVFTDCEVDKQSDTVCVHYAAAHVVLSLLCHGSEQSLQILNVPIGSSGPKFSRQADGEQ